MHRLHPRINLQHPVPFHPKKQRDQPAYREQQQNGLILQVQPINPIYTPFADAVAPCFHRVCRLQRFLQRPGQQHLHQRHAVPHSGAHAALACIHSPNPLDHGDLAQTPLKQRHKAQRHQRQQGSPGRSRGEQIHEFIRGNRVAVRNEQNTNSQEDRHHQQPVQNGFQCNRLVHKIKQNMRPPV
ncbi:hypothetical protein D3C73_1125480 [compost metagenome]